MHVKTNQLKNKVIYQIYPKSFLDTTGNGIGDIQGIRSKLEYLSQLGVDYLWLSPINASPQHDNGYDISNYDQVDPLFGSNQEYLIFIKEAKEKGMKIMMDLVLNHTSDQHTWFQKALANDPIYREYYIFRDKPNEMTSIFGGSAWTYSAELDQYYFHFFDSHQPDLNWENPVVREELYAMINRWISLGVEGFRLDVIDLIGKEPDRYIGARGPKFYEYLKELNNATFQDKIVTVGECWGATFEDAAKMCHPDGLTQLFHFNHLTTTNHNHSKWDQKPLDLHQLTKIIEQWQNEYDGIEAIVMNNHDSPRLLSLWLNDQEYRKESAMLLISLFGVLKGNLYLYQGEEIGMTNAHFKDISFYNDIETLNKYHELMQLGLCEEEILAKLSLVSRDNARTPMQWDSSENGGFSKGTPWLAVNSNYPNINAKADLLSETSIYRYYQRVITYRKQNEALLDQSCIFEVVGNLSSVVFFNKGTLRGYYNFSKEKQEVTQQFRELVEKINKSECSVLFHNYAGHSAFLRPYEAIVVAVE